MRWAPAAAFVPKNPLDQSAKPPHTLIILLIQDEPGEDLFQAEVMVLTAAMITRLEGEDCLDYNTIPARIHSKYSCITENLICLYNI